MKTRYCLPAVFFAVIALLAAPLAAQPDGLDDGGTVAGVGVATLERPAEIMRMQVQLLAKGKDIEEALKRLKARREDAQAQLESLGADMKSIEFGEPSVDSAMGDRQRQMEMMIRARRGGGKSKPKTAKSRPVRLVATLKAEWPLTEGDAEQLLLVTHELMEKVKEADLAGTKEAEELSPEEEELSEETQEMMGYSSDEQEPGTPVFFFVTKVSDEQRAKLMAEAYEKAKKHAGRLAAAAGAKLGALSNLEGSSSSQPGYGGGYDPYAYQMLSQAGIEDEDSETGEVTEAVSVKPGKIGFLVTVNASFALE